MDTSLIAQLVPDVRPEACPSPVIWPAATSGGDEQQVQICRIVELRTGQSGTAEGLFYQLIVRLHKYLAGSRGFQRRASTGSAVWFWKMTTRSARLLEHVGNDVRITVRSPYPERFLAALTYEVKWLVENFWKGMRCEVMVPCLVAGRTGEPCKGLFEVGKLIENKRRRPP